MNIDLHIHTCASDGSMEPAEVVRMAAGATLNVISITDHDTMAGLPEAMSAVRHFPGLTLIPGVEVSASDPRGEVHILGYWVEHQDPTFQAFLSTPCSTRRPRIARMCEKLTEMGLPVRAEEVFEEAGYLGSVGRPHLARVLLRKGFVKSTNEAFDRYLATGCPAYVKRFKNSAEETIRMIHQCGGVPVIAHPGLIEDPALVLSLIRYGARGIEVFCHEHNPEAQKGFLKLAEQHGLLVTGGSDFHGATLGQPFRLGALKVPYSCYEKLNEARRSGPVRKEEPQETRRGSVV